MKKISTLLLLLITTISYSQSKIAVVESETSLRKFQKEYQLLEYNLSQEIEKLNYKYKVDINKLEYNYKLKQQKLQAKYEGSAVRSILYQREYQRKSQDLVNKFQAEINKVQFDFKTNLAKINVEFNTKINKLKYQLSATK
jgi:hypothetical protein